MNQMAKATRISIVSAVDDHPPDLQLWFHSLDRQTMPAEDYEVIVVDATHQVDYQACLELFGAQKGLSANISCHRVERGGRARALNHALKVATGDIVIFLGDDYLPPPEFAEAHLRFHRAHPEEEAVGIGSAIIVPALRTPFSVWLEESGQLYGVPFRANMTQVPEDFFYVGNASVKRQLLQRAGRFDERFAHHAWDDFELGKRLLAAGMRAQFVPDARADHVHRIDLHERERAMRHAGAAARVYLAEHPEKYGWFEAVRLPPWRHWLRVANARMRLALTATDDALVKWWQSRLDAAFEKGYRKGT